MENVVPTAESAVEQEQAAQEVSLGAAAEQVVPETAEQPSASEDQEAATPEQVQSKEEKPQDKDSKVKETTDPEAENPETALKEKEKALLEREAALQRKEIEDAARDLLKEHRLPVDKALSMVQAGTKEEVQARVETLRDIVAEAAEARLNEALRGRTPTGPAGVVTDGDKTVADVFAAALRG